MSQTSYPDYVSTLSNEHPVKTYFEESDHIKSILDELTRTDANQDFPKFFNLFNQLSEIEKRFTRKENQLFPYLEKRGWNGPSQGMWAFHDSIRDLFRGVRKKLEAKNYKDLNQDIDLIISEINRLMMVEEMRLFPNSLAILSDEDWKEMIAGEEEIGWMINKTPQSQKSVPTNSTDKKDLPFPLDARIRLDEGYMTPEQINLMLQFMPFDLTYVDENDRVVFYNRGEERVFPRSAGVIGREVRFCHPPKSVDTVLKIVEAFRNGTKDSADFWIQYRGKMLHIRYFAIRDKNKNYKGVIEVSQDITEIQKLTGEKRLLDWQ